MKKRKLVFASTIFAFALFSCGGPKADGKQEFDGKDTTVAESAEEKPLEEANLMSESFTLNLDSSKVHWAGNMVGVYTHEGWVKLKEGKIEVTDGAISGGAFVVDMTTITPTDENFNPEEGKTPEKLVDHLSSDDFFLVSEYPTAKFEITSADMSNNQLMGNLTIRGITHEETIENVKFNREEGIASGELIFDRSVYDVNFKHPAQDMVLSDDIELDIVLHTKQNVEEVKEENAPS